MVSSRARWPWCPASGRGWAATSRCCSPSTSADLALGARSVEKCEAVGEEVAKLGRKATPCSSTSRTRARATPPWPRPSRASVASTSSSTTPSRTATFSARFAEEPDLEQLAHDHGREPLGHAPATQIGAQMRRRATASRIVMTNTMSAGESRRASGPTRRRRRRWRRRPRNPRHRARRGRDRGQHHPTPATSGPSRSRQYLGYLGRKGGPHLRGAVPASSHQTETCLGYPLPHSSEIAGAVLFFASDLSKPMTGQTLHVSCGHWIEGSDVVLQLTRARP